MELEKRVTAHYSQSSPSEAVRAALEQGGGSMDRLTPADLLPFEDLHMGGRAATADLAEHLELQPGMRVLDVGSGIGGSARFVAREHRCIVDGIDLTPEYVALANDLTRRVGLSELASFQRGSALRLPFASEEFHRAYLIHVGMNISEKEKLFSEVYRVLQAGGLFGVYDVMRLSDDPFAFPMPWASSEEGSFVEMVAFYRSALERAGFAIVSERDLWTLGLAGSSAMQEVRMEAGAPAGSHIFMGETAPQKRANLFAATKRRVISPIQLIARK